MHILLTNDDGIDAPGLSALESVVSQFAKVTVVAPNQGYSGCGHLVTSDKPIQVEAISDRRYKVFGTPADCTRIGLAEIAPDVDWVFAGVNFGGNLGVDLWMSGTVAATREAAWMGKRAIALSQYVKRDRQRDWEQTGRIANRVLRELIERELEPGRFWNVNFPDVDTPVEELEMVDAPPEPTHFNVKFDKVGEGSFQYAGDYRNRPRISGSDVDVCFGGAIALSCICDS